jgi:acyl-CoA reductase-like NAD-dependent aldehyde dehydrogenase
MRLPPVTNRATPISSVFFSLIATDHRTQSPVSGETLATFDQSTNAVVEKASNNAASTVDIWHALSVAERAEHLR